MCYVCGACVKVKGEQSHRIDCKSRTVGRRGAIRRVPPREAEHLVYAAIHRVFITSTGCNLWYQTLPSRNIEQVVQIEGVCHRPQAPRSAYGPEPAVDLQVPMSRIPA